MGEESEDYVCALSQTRLKKIMTGRKKKGKLSGKSRTQSLNRGGGNHRRESD